MTVPHNVTDITPYNYADGYVIVSFSNGSKMITDTLEYVGVGYRSPEIVNEMSDRIGFNVVDSLKGILFTKL